MRRTALLLTAAALAAATTASAQTQLRYKFSPGEAATYVTTTTTQSDVPAGGMTMKTQAEQTMTSKRTVTKVNDDGSAEVSDLTESLKMKNQVTGGPIPMTMEWDSTTGEPPTGQLAMAAPVLTALVGSATTYTMSPTGEVSGTEYAEDVREAVKSMPNGEQMLQQFDVNAVTLPEEAVSVGDAWPFEFGSGGAGGKMTLSGEMTLMSVEGGVAVIEGPFTVAVDGEMMPGMKMDVKKSEGKMTTRFDVEQGHILEQTTDLDMTVDMSFAGQQMTSSTKSKTVVKRSGS